MTSDRSFPTIPTVRLSLGAHAAPFVSRNRIGCKSFWGSRSKELRDLRDTEVAACLGRDPPNIHKAR